VYRPHALAALAFTATAFAFAAFAFLAVIPQGSASSVAFAVVLALLSVILSGNLLRLSLLLPLPFTPAFR
jgi:hypothetical protein